MYERWLNVYVEKRVKRHFCRHIQRKIYKGILAEIRSEACVEAFPRQRSVCIGILKDVQVEMCVGVLEQFMQRSLHKDILLGANLKGV
jgi:hypothetical protein